MTKGTATAALVHPREVFRPAVLANCSAVIVAHNHPSGDPSPSQAVKLVNELDRCSRDAQDLLLSYLDKLPPGRAFIGTSNLNPGDLTERFQTRFQAIKLLSPDSDEIRDFLMNRWRVPEPVAARIAVGCVGNVRAALADLENHMDATEGLR